MPVFTDQTGRDITLPRIPVKIISVVPSQTEFLYALGLDPEVIAITRFCIHPRMWHDHKIKVGGTKKLDLARIDQLSPDLIIANKEENTREQIERLAQLYPVWVSDIGNLREAYSMMLSIGEMTGKYDKARALVTEVQTEFGSLAVPDQRPGVLYLIWQKPFMTTGSDTFIHAMLVAAGFRNVFSDAVRYPIITLDEIQAKRPELILLSSEPFPFREKHINELRVSLPDSAIMLVDGEMFSWYGSRLLLAPGYFRLLRNKLDYLAGN